MLKIFSEECEVVIGLVDVDFDCENVFEVVGDLFDEDEIDIIGDLVNEGDVVNENDDIEGIEYREMKLGEYVSKMKEFCEMCLED